MINSVVQTLMHSCGRNISSRKHAQAAVRQSIVRRYLSVSQSVFKEILVPTCKLSRVSRKWKAFLIVSERSEQVTKLSTPSSASPDLGIRPQPSLCGTIGVQPIQFTFFKKDTQTRFVNITLAESSVLSSKEQVLYFSVLKDSHTHKHFLVKQNTSVFSA
jgi:hypothetical protein